MSEVIAFDIGGTKSRIMLLDQGKIVWRDEAPTPSQQGPEAMIANMVALHRPVSDRNAKIGVAIAGHIADGHVTAHNPALLPGWDHYPLRTALSAQLHRPVQVLNDARAAAWGEHVCGAGRGYSEFLFVTISTGVGAGLILNGRLHIARNGFDAELGVTRIANGDTLEDHASGTALGRMALQHGYANAKALCDAADQGDQTAEELYCHGIQEIASKLADCSVMLGIQRVAIGGSVGLRPGYLDRLRMAMAKLPQIYQPELALAELGHDAGLYGAAALAQLAQTASDI